MRAHIYKSEARLPFIAQNKEIHVFTASAAFNEKCKIIVGAVFQSLEPCIIAFKHVFI